MSKSRPNKKKTALMLRDFQRDSKSTLNKSAFTIVLAKKKSMSVYKLGTSGSFFILKRKQCDIYGLMCKSYPGHGSSLLVTGVIEGSNLGSRLFKIFINDKNAWCQTKHSLFIMSKFNYCCIAWNFVCCSH